MLKNALKAFFSADRVFHEKTFYTVGRIFESKKQIFPMDKNGPIVLIEDDEDDRMIFENVFNDLSYHNKILHCQTGEEALAVLDAITVQPFLIISDIHLPGTNGIELRNQVGRLESTRLRCIPYILFTGGVPAKALNDQYAKSIQGIFIKPASLGETRKLIKMIVEYWQTCHQPMWN